MGFGENLSVWKNPSDFSGEGKSGINPYLVFKSDFPEGATLLLCCYMWKLYTEVPEISRIRHRVCVCVCVPALSLCAWKRHAHKELAVF